MFQFFGKTDFDFMGNRVYAYALSACVAGGSLVLLATRGINYSIEFTGGTLVQVTFDKPISLGDLRAAVEMQYRGLEIQSFSGQRSFSMRAKTEAEHVAAAADRIEQAVRRALPDRAVTVDRREFIGPVVGRHLFKQTVLAILLSLVGIILYVAFRFENPVWGFAGVLALAHDVVGALGLIILTRWEFDLLLVAALLTVAGFSINDTIVIFDRMREKMRLMRKAPMDQVINESLNETLSRTIITMCTVLLVLLVLFLLGGEVLHAFAATLLFGVGIGMYSSIGVAAPLVDDWERMQRR